MTGNEKKATKGWEGAGGPGEEILEWYAILKKKLTGYLLPILHFISGSYYRFRDS